MGLLKGQLEHDKFKAGKKLTYKQTLLAQCYICNGGKEGGVDCRGYDCPLYPHMPYKATREAAEDGTFTGFKRPGGAGNGY